MSGRRKNNPAHQGSPRIGQLPPALASMPVTPCLVCDAWPISVQAWYAADKPTRECKRRVLFYCLCSDCEQEVMDEKTGDAALAGIERRFEAKGLI